MKIFDKIMDKLNENSTDLGAMYNLLGAINRNIGNMQNRDKLINDQAKTIENQIKIINDLINNIYSQDTSLEAVMIKPYRSKPVIYKDGKKISTDTMTGFDIDWSYDSRIDISVRSE